MRDELSRASSQFEREFGAAPRIRGSLHFGPVIVGEIGDVKRAIVFNGDVMNTAARLEELSRKVDGGFLASRAAMERFSSAPPFAVRDLGRLPIRGRADGIDVVGIDAPGLRLICWPDLAHLTGDRSSRAIRPSASGSATSASPAWCRAAARR